MSTMTYRAALQAATKAVALGFIGADERIDHALGLMATSRRAVEMIAGSAVAVAPVVGSGDVTVVGKRSAR